MSQPRGMGMEVSCPGETPTNMCCCGSRLIAAFGQLFLTFLLMAGKAWKCYVQLGAGARSGTGSGSDLRGAGEDRTASWRMLRDTCLCPKKGIEQDQCCPGLLSTSIPANLHHSSQPPAQAGLPPSHFPAPGGSHVHSAARHGVVMSLMGPDGSCSAGSLIALSVISFQPRDTTPLHTPTGGS